jgi:vacuolar-type H+-ATPase subunit F/Vma7
MTMGTVVVIGKPALVDGYALAGAIVVTAEGPAETRQAWQELPADVSLVILTAAAAEALSDELAGAEPMTVVMPA